MTQDEYILILFSDCGIDTSSQRRAFIQKRFEKSYLDEIDSRQKALLINELKDMKADKYIKED